MSAGNSLTERGEEYVSNVSVILPQSLEARYLYYNYVHLFVLHDYFYLSACVLYDTSYGAIYNAQSQFTQCTVLVCYGLYCAL
jgi:hypothetical protein